MTSTKHSTNSREHQEVWELLPWYANGTLSARDEARVAQHLPACPLCQRELQRCRHLSVSAKATDDAAWSPSPRHFAQVLAHIDKAETIRSSSAPNSLPLLHKICAWFFATPRPMRWAFAVQTALLLALAGGLLLKTAGPAAMYETLSRAGEPVATDSAQLRMIFSEDVSGKELRDLLQGIDAQIVQGPSSMGVYTIQLPFPTSAQERMKQVLAGVRAHPKVRLAEPVGAASAQ
jgi:hypothetical protein